MNGWMPPNLGLPVPVNVAKYLPLGGRWPWVVDSMKVSLDVPSELTEGSSGNQATVIIHNTSYYQNTSVLAPYIFIVSVSIEVAEQTIWLSHDVPQSLGADEYKTIQYLFDIPSGVSGGGLATAKISNTSNATTIDIKQKNVTIISVVPTIYAATVTILD